MSKEGDAKFYENKIMDKPHQRLTRSKKAKPKKIYRVTVTYVKIPDDDAKARLSIIESILRKSQL